jgi:F-type H+-transporting ATPase subunit epsilon
MPLDLEVATPSRLVVADTADEVVIPGSQGYFGVLPGHAPLLATLGVGELMYRKGTVQYHLVLTGGFAEVRNDKVIVLAENAERPDEIDRDRALKSKERAEQRLSGREGDVDFVRAQTALARALIRLQVAAYER